MSSHKPRKHSQRISKGRLDAMPFDQFCRYAETKALTELFKGIEKIELREVQFEAGKGYNIQINFTPALANALENSVEDPEFYRIDNPAETLLLHALKVAISTASASPAYPINYNDSGKGMYLDVDYQMTGPHIDLEKDGICISSAGITNLKLHTTEAVHRVMQGIVDFLERERTIANQPTRTK